MSPVRESVDVKVVFQAVSLVSKQNMAAALSQNFGGEEMLSELFLLINQKCSKYNFHKNPR